MRAACQCGPEQNWGCTLTAWWYLTGGPRRDVIIASVSPQTPALKSPGIQTTRPSVWGLFKIIIRKNLFCRNTYFFFHVAFVIAVVVAVVNITSVCITPMSNRSRCHWKHFCSKKEGTQWECFKGGRCMTHAKPPLLSQFTFVFNSCPLHRDRVHSWTTCCQHLLRRFKYIYFYWECKHEEHVQKWLHIAHSPLYLIAMKGTRGHNVDCRN